MSAWERRAALVVAVLIPEDIARWGTSQERERVDQPHLFVDSPGGPYSRAGPPPVRIALRKQSQRPHVTPILTRMDKLNTSLIVFGGAIAVWSLVSQGLKFRNAKKLHKVTVEINGNRVILDADDPADVATIRKLARENESAPVLNDAAAAGKTGELPADGVTDDNPQQPGRG